MLIDVSMNASPKDGLIVTEDRFFLKPGESGSLEAPMPFIRARVSVRPCERLSSNLHSTHTPDLRATAFQIFHAGLLYLLRFGRVDDMGAYSIPFRRPALLIPSVYDSLSTAWVELGRSRPGCSVICKAKTYYNYCQWEKAACQYRSTERAKVRSNWGTNPFN